ncbi:hypothetical protein HELRODRAFT_175079 [Helobdella robusta]|uniref:Uncharacterized protein n=1 Tax=Helobdella robusta TaxID=6412 RepID=T1F8T8_HELRO|nr:hypothetical protein HELRODRAFT_175079 [Helobdella robusta]ESO01052.1 hypothetical protein HELRODRAFT_175079 [Helobdella robusta]
MCNNPDWNKSSKAIRRRQFIISLGESLVEPLIRKHLDNSVRLRKSIMDAIQLLELDLGKRRIKIPTNEKRTQDVVICARAYVTGILVCSAKCVPGPLVRHIL